MQVSETSIFSPQKAFSRSDPLGLILCSLTISDALIRSNCVFNTQIHLALNHIAMSSLKASLSEALGHSTSKGDVSPHIPTLYILQRAWDDAICRPRMQSTKFLRTYLKHQFCREQRRLRRRFTKALNIPTSFIPTYSFLSQ